MEMLTTQMLASTMQMTQRRGCANRLSQTDCEAGAWVAKDDRQNVQKIQQY